jgi:conjugative transfer signal peptidase TraF
MKIHRVKIFWGFFLLGFFFFPLCVFRAGYRFNNSASVPVGIWKIDPVPGNAQKDGYAVLPPEAQPAHRFAVERGYFDKGQSLLKKIAAVAGDLVDYDPESASVTVNGQPLPYSSILSADSAGLPIIQSTKFPVRLAKGEIWLSSENIRGFDSRYFGPVSADFAVRAVPVFLF